MKAETKSLLKDIALTTLVLVVIAIVAGGILAGVSALTYIDPAEVLAQKLSTVYESPEGFSENLHNEDILVDGDVYKTGTILGVYKPKDNNDAVIIHASGSGAYKKTIEVMIVINDYKIIKIAKYRSDETPGLGANAFTDEHMGQYYGDFKDVDKFELKKKVPTGTIDAVTAATKTSTALNNAVNVAISYYKTNHDNLVGGAN